MSDFEVIETARGGTIKAWVKDVPVEPKAREQFGLTAGVLKVVAAVEGATGAGGGKGAKPTKGGGKRASAPAADDGKQRKLSAFFQKKAE